jgi:hypothetical protein
LTRSSRWTALALLCAAWLAAGAPAAAQDDYLFRASLAAGFGGSLDSDSDNAIDNDALQASFGMVTNDRTLAQVRAGRFALDSDGDFEGLFDAELEFVNVAGEYRFRQPYYDFGVYLGLGGYRLTGDLPGSGEESESALGIALGLVGDFDLTQHLAIVVEASAHYALFDERSNLYTIALGGLAVRF